MPKRKRPRITSPCPFCSKQCDTYASQSFRCAKCDVVFYVDNSVDNGKIFEKIFNCNINGVHYILDLNHLDNKTSLRYMHHINNDYVDFKELKTFDYIIDVNPQTLIQKIKTILTFS